MPEHPIAMNKFISDGANGSLLCQSDAMRVLGMSAERFQLNRRKCRQAWFAYDKVAPTEPLPPTVAIELGTLMRWPPKDLIKEDLEVAKFTWALVSSSTDWLARARIVCASVKRLLVNCVAPLVVENIVATAVALEYERYGANATRFIIVPRGFGIAGVEVINGGDKRFVCYECLRRKTVPIRGLANRLETFVGFLSTRPETNVGHTTEIRGKGVRRIPIDLVDVPAAYIVSGGQCYTTGFREELINAVVEQLMPFNICDAFSALGFIYNAIPLTYFRDEWHEGGILHNEALWNLYSDRKYSKLLATLPRCLLGGSSQQVICIDTFDAELSEAVQKICFSRDRMRTVNNCKRRITKARIRIKHLESRLSIYIASACSSTSDGDGDDDSDSDSDGDDDSDSDGDDDSDSDGCSDSSSHGSVGVTGEKGIRKLRRTIAHCAATLSDLGYTAKLSVEESMACGYIQPSKKRKSVVECAVSVRVPTPRPTRKRKSAARGSGVPTPRSSNERKSAARAACEYPHAPKKRKSAECATLSPSKSAESAESPMDKTAVDDGTDSNGGDESADGTSNESEDGNGSDGEIDRNQDDDGTDSNDGDGSDDAAMGMSETR